MNKFIMTFILLIGVINLKAQLGNEISFGAGVQSSIDFNTLKYDRVYDENRNQSVVSWNTELTVLPSFVFRYGVDIAKLKIQAGPKTGVTVELGRYFLYNFGAGWDFFAGGVFIENSIGGRIPLDKNQKVWLELHTKAIVIANSFKLTKMRKLDKDLDYIDNVKLDQFNLVPLALFISYNFSKDSKNKSYFHY